MTTLVPQRPALRFRPITKDEAQATGLPPCTQVEEGASYDDVMGIDVLRVEGKPNA